MLSVPSENILKLRSLTEKLSCQSDLKDNEIVLEIKNILESNLDIITNSEKANTKIKRYEVMFSKIMSLLQKLN
jgi:hypothetical protein